MAKKRYRLTPALVQQIVSGIRAGAYPLVAAEAFGVPDDVLRDWLRRGDAPRARPPYAPFAASVRQARAQARLRAESEVFSDAAQVWLQHGPGRERAGQPGWSAAVKGPAAQGTAEGNAWLSPAFLTLVRAMIDDLGDASEMRVRLSQHVVDAGRADETPSSWNIAA